MACLLSHPNLREGSKRRGSQAQFMEPLEGQAHPYSPSQQIGTDPQKQYKSLQSPLSPSTAPCTGCPNKAAPASSTSSSNYNSQTQRPSQDIPRRAAVQKGVVLLGHQPTQHWGFASGWPRMRGPEPSLDSSCGPATERHRESGSKALGNRVGDRVVG